MMTMKNTLKELVNAAQELGIEVSKEMKKADILALIKEAEEVQEAPEEAEEAEEVQEAETEEEEAPEDESRVIIEQASKKNRFRVSVDGKMVCRLTTTKKVIYLQPGRKMKEFYGEEFWDFHKGWDCPYTHEVNDFDDVRNFVEDFLTQSEEAEEEPAA